MNYDILMQEEIKALKTRPRLFLHSCCGPCSSYVLKTLVNFFDIDVFYYNPNIEPDYEYEKRKETQKKLIEKLNKKNNINFIECSYENELFHQAVIKLETEVEGGKRCNICFNLRLEKTATYAKKYNYDYFGTTLTVSPHKNSKIINKLGLELSKKYNLKFLVSDFKKRDGYKESLILSKKYKLYRQDYCGCIYSKTK